MDNRKIGALVVLALLALGSAWLLPRASGEGQEVRPQRSLVERVKVLEEQVADLLTRVEALEEGTCRCDVMYLAPLSDFPDNPSEGDLCVVGESDSQHIYCYLNGDWLQLDLPSTPPITPPITPPGGPGTGPPQE